MFWVGGDRHHWGDKKPSGNTFYPRRRRELQRRAVQVYLEPGTAAFLAKRMVAGRTVTYSSTCSVAGFPLLLPGQDRGTFHRVHVNLVPKSSCVRSLISCAVHKLGRAHSRDRHGRCGGWRSQDFRVRLHCARKAGRNSAWIARSTKHFVGWSPEYTSRKTKQQVTTAMFCTVVGEAEMQKIWDKVNATRRPQGVRTWFCPHAWYKVIPDIDLAAAEHEKACLETSDGKWVDILFALAQDFGLVQEPCRDRATRPLPARRCASCGSPAFGVRALEGYTSSNSPSTSTATGSVVHQAARRTSGVSCIVTLPFISTRRRTAEFRLSDVF